MQLSTRIKVAIVFWAACAMVVASSVHLRAVPADEIMLAQAGEEAAQPESGHAVTVQGTVLGPDERPVADARVLVMYQSLDHRWPQAETRSTADGSFSFKLEVRDPTRKLSVGALMAGLAPDWTRAQPGENVVLKLGAATATCTGVVLDAQGKPLAGVEVSLHGIGGSDEKRQASGGFHFADDKAPRTATDATGHFSFSDLPPGGTVTLIAVTEGLTRSTRGEGNYFRLDEPNIRLTLYPAGSASGRMLYEGKPVSGVHVWAAAIGVGGDNHDTTSGADGTWRLEHLYPGSYRIRTSATKEFAGCPGVEFEVRAGQHREDVDIHLVRGGAIQGTVRDPEGQPVSRVHMGVHVYADRGVGDLVAGLDTGADGRYRARVAPGKYVIGYLWGPTKPRGAVEPVRHVVEVSEGQTVTDIDFTLTGPAQVKGRVLLPDGQAAAGVQLAILGVGPRRSKDAVSTQQIWEDFFTAHTDDDGQFKLAAKGGLTDGDNLYLGVLACDVKQELAGLALLDNLKGFAEIHMEQGAWVIVRVIDLAGEPVAGVRFHVLAAHARIVFSVGLPGGVTGKDGRARIGPLPTGHSLSVRLDRRTRPFVAEGGQTCIRDTVLQAGEERVLEPITVNMAGRSVKGWVGDAQQQPVAGALVCSSWSDVSTRTNDQGLFEITGLRVAGDVWLIAVHPLKSLFAAEKLDPDWGYEPGLILKPTGSASGRIVDAQGKPISAATVWLGLDSTPPAALQKYIRQLPWASPTRTDAAGKWRMDGLIGGANYRVTVVPPGSNTQRRLGVFVAKPGESVDAGEMQFGN